MSELEALKEKVQKLQERYSQDLLLEIVGCYKKIIDKDQIESRMYMEAHEDLLDALENNDTTVESFYSDINIIFTRYSELLTEYRKEYISPIEESHLRVNLSLPLDLLLIIFVLNHPEYDSEISLWEFEKQLEPFSKALEDK